MVRAFVQRTDREDLRLRFGRPLNFDDEPTLRRSFGISNGDSEIVWVLDDQGTIAGISHRVPLSRSEADIALIVRSDMKRRGIGEFLLRTLVTRAAARGLKTLTALVMRENRPMLQLAARIGYATRGFAALTVELVFDVGQATEAYRADH